MHIKYAFSSLLSSDIVTFLQADVSECTFVYHDTIDKTIHTLSGFWGGLEEGSVLAEEEKGETR